MICLLPHCGYLSETSRMLEIYRALRERGAPVRVATHGGTYENVLRQAGVAYDIVGPRMADERFAALVRAGADQGAPDQSGYTDEELRTYVRAEAEYFAAHRITVAVTGFTLTTLLSTRLAGVRLVTEHAGCWVPPVFERHLVPLPSKPVVPGLRYLPRPLARRVFNAIPPRIHAYCAGFNRVAREFGVPEVPSLAALLLGDLTLVPEAPEVLGIPPAQLDAWEPAGRPGYRPGTRMRYTGPLYARLPVPLPERVAEFLDHPGPVVYVAITSSRPALVRAAVHALSTLDTRILVAGTVHDLSDLDSARVLVAGVLPSHEIMPRVDLAVTAGGQGSVQTAMAAGTPVLGIPLQPEQDLNVALLQRQGAARLVPVRHAGTRKLTRAAARMVADRRYRDAAQRIRRVYARIDGPGNAAEAVMSLLVPTLQHSARG
jgi:UDP:flavonoid glycosyltransferase YjiC (YdhE family)